MQEPDDKRPTVVDGPRGATIEDEQAALIGTDVGGYVIECELGRGGMGVVYQATHPMIGKRAAIKVIKSSLSKNPATVERFLQEARSVNQIGHPNIVDIFAFGTLPDGRSYLVMDLLEGEPLRKRVKRSAVPPNEAVQLLEEIASALAAAHHKGFVHRDLKPDNVFLVSNPTRFEVKLLDFGLAKLLPKASLENDRAFRTATGAQIGTPDYMSPEQLRGSDRVDHRTDIYALGIMAFEILARSRPHRYSDGSFELEGLTFKQALLAVPGVPDQLAELLERMVARDPDDRPTLDDVRKTLKSVRPSLPSLPALSSVRAVGSEMSLGAFSPSQVGARPTISTPPQGAPVAAAPVAPAPAPTPIPSTSGQYGGLRASGNNAQSPHLATKLGVAPPPKPKTTKPPAQVAARRGAGENRLWLVIGTLLVVGATIALVVVLAG